MTTGIEILLLCFVALGVGAVIGAELERYIQKHRQPPPHPRPKRKRPTS